MAAVIGMTADHEWCSLPCCCFWSSLCVRCLRCLQAARYTKISAAAWIRPTTAVVALQYVANKVRQGDADKAVAVRTEDGQPVLEIRESIEGGDYITWIYYYEGSIRELFTYEDSGLGLADGLEILECDGLTITQEGQLLHVATLGTGGGSLTLSLRSGRTVTGQ